MAHNYDAGTRAWHSDPTEGWVASEVRSKTVHGDKVTLLFELSNGEVKNPLPHNRLGRFNGLTMLLQQTRVVETTTAALADDATSDLPPLMNPAILEASDDLTNLSYLNEPAGMLAPIPIYAKPTLISFQFYKPSSCGIRKKRSTHTAALFSLPQILLHALTHYTCLVWSRYMQESNGPLKPRIFSLLLKKLFRKACLRYR